MIAALRQRFWWLHDPEPVREVVKTSEPGLSDREVEEFAIVHDERTKIRNEQSGADGSGGTAGVPTNGAGGRPERLF